MIGDITDQDWNRAQTEYIKALGAGNILTEENLSDPQATKEAIYYLITAERSTGNSDLDNWVTGVFTPQVRFDAPVGVEGFVEEKGLWGRISQFFVKAFEAVWSGFRDYFNLGITDTIQAIKDLGKPYDKAATRESLKWFIDAGLLDADTMTEFERVFGDRPFLRVLMPIIGIITAGVTILKSLFTLGGADYNKRLLRIFTPNQPSVEQLVRLGFTAPGKTDAVRRGLAKNGMSEEDQNLIFQASLNMLDVNTIQTLFLRGFISSDEVFQRMRQIGFTDGKTELIMKTWEVLPGIGELVTMVDREAFDDAIVAKYGYMEDSDKLPYDIFAKMGLSRFWVDKIWAAHWNLPSLEMGFRMLHRRIIDEDELDDLFKIAEIPGYWRERLKALSYNPLTRVDIRRMHAMNVLGEQEVFNAYLDHGYNRENALLMTEFTIKYNEDEDRALSRSQVETFYRNNRISHEEAMGLLSEIGYPESRAIFFLANQDYEKEQEYVDDVIDNTGEMYRMRQLEYNEAQQKLYDLNLTAKEVTALFDKWNIRMFKDRKLPSKTDLDKFYKAGVITLVTYGEELEKLGYPEKYVNMYMTLAEQGGK
jgi:hypothetical protein